jgi:hypothetical protein
VIAKLLMGLLADVVFDSVSSAQPSFADEMRRYLDDRGFRPLPATSTIDRR